MNNLFKRITQKSLTGTEVWGRIEVGGSMIINEFNANTFKITVEEKQNNTYIATYWDKELELELDRTVREYETYGGAVDKAFRWMADIMEGFVAENKI